jgi:hypothetical protein
MYERRGSVAYTINIYGLSIDLILIGSTFIACEFESHFRHINRLVDSSNGISSLLTP